MLANGKFSDTFSSIAIGSLFFSVTGLIGSSSPCVNGKFSDMGSTASISFITDKSLVFPEVGMFFASDLMDFFLFNICIFSGTDINDLLFSFGSDKFSLDLEDLFGLLFFFGDGLMLSCSAKEQTWRFVIGLMVQANPSQHSESGEHSSRHDKHSTSFWSCTSFVSSSWSCTSCASS